MIANDEQNDKLTLPQTYKTISSKSKIFKVAEYWGAETPFANLSDKSLYADKHSTNTKECISIYPDSNTTQSLTLIENILADYTVNRRKTITNRISDCTALFLSSIPLAISQICRLLAYQS
ncbi:unnamed protein product [Onchocerca flexuosa]|uniref:Transposase n=1 Tax=Onchocerca flexuosa TaxID=387005 RepID=A0A183HLI7_9BILA|nr:unnamed protein product [Onchocerca flexuosa]